MPLTTPEMLLLLTGPQMKVSTVSQPCLTPGLWWFHCFHRQCTFSFHSLQCSWYHMSLSFNSRAWFMKLSFVDEAITTLPTLLKFYFLLKTDGNESYASLYSFNPFLKAL